MLPVSFPKLTILFAFSLGFFAVVGCGAKSSEKLVPVSGTVSSDGQPLTVGTVTFMPDESKGNTSKLSPTGMVDPSGNYKMTANGQDGAPLGWYKVGVNPNGMVAGGMPIGTGGDPNTSLAKAKAAVNMKYQTPTSSGIRIEVTTSPAAGVYDIKVTK
ncbi:MAG TPA: hypothetical protein VH092_22315 [Urbifossiella sp.]|nr:hypothetical protein [Urbifossiella sp.]